MTGGDIRYIDENGKKYTLEDAFAYEFLLLAIILLTFLFAWKYMKREFTIIFLILLGPISCITYPIDKISDGKAQAFNKWLTEFIYNVLVQPFHLLLYTVLCGSAIELANQNILYGLACLAMLIPAEKFIKEMFGFKDHLGGGPLAAATTGAVASQLMNKVKGLGSGKSSGGSGGSDNNNNTATKIKNKDVDRSVLTDGQTGSEIPDTEEGNQPLTVEESENPNTEDGNEPQTVEESENPYTEDGNQPRTVEESETEETDKNTDSEESENKNIDEKSGGDSQTKRASFGRRLLDAHNERVTEKWGSADRKKRWKKRVIKGGKSLGKGTYKAAKGSLKIAGALAGASVGAAVGLLSGKGIAAGAAAGYKLTGSAINKAEKSVSGVVNDYRDRMQTPEQREKRQKKAFMEDKNEIKKAIESFKERHEGRGPSDKEFEKEMEDRYELKSYGMTDEEIDDSLSIYQKHLQEQINNGKSEEDAKKIAASKTMTSAKWKKRISADKFTDPKAMQNAVDSISRSLQASTKCNKDVADEYARQYLTDAGEMHGLKKEEIALPPQKVKVPPQTIRTVLASRGVNDEETIRLCQQYELDLSDIKIISELEQDNDKFKARIDTIIGVQQMSNPQYKTAKEVNKSEIDSIQIEKGFEIKGDKNEIKSKVQDVKNFEKDKKVTSKQRELAMKAVRGELSNNDKNAITDKEKEIINEYKEILGANK